jgi:selenocysteine-specific elongation factor
MIVGTAGHIDHGKTSLVRALTGVDTDRLKEEKARGISIDLGFAYLPVQGGETLGFVDVPGHEKFVHTMVAGASGIDFVLLVVAANDGIMPQTREHLAIVDLLGVGSGVVALSKADLVSPERLAEVEASVRSELANATLAEVPAIAVSAATGAGLDALRAHLIDASRGFARREASGRFRLAVDRSFTLVGAGTVVTGTVLSGSIGVGERVVVSPRGVSGRVRSIYTQNRPSERGRAGDRCALNLTGEAITKDAITRGDMVLDPDLHAPTDRIDATLRALPSEPKRIGHWFPVRLHHAAAEVGARIVLLSDEAGLPGQQGRVQLVLDRPIAAAAGDPYVVRDTSAKRTIGGGHFLDLRAPVRKRRTAERAAQLDAYACQAPQQAMTALLDAPPHYLNLSAFARDRALTTAEVNALAERNGAVRFATGGSVLAISAANFARFHGDLLSRLVGFHADNPDILGIALERLRLQLEPRLPASAFRSVLLGFARAGEIGLDGAFVRLSSHEAKLTAKDEELWFAVSPLLGGTERFRPPRVRDIAGLIAVPEPEILHVLKLAGRLGLVHEIAHDHFFPRATVAEMVEIVIDVAAKADEGWFKAAQFRDRMDNGRKVAIQVLDFFDRHGVTLRRGDLRRLNKHRLDLFRDETSHGGSETTSSGRETSLVGRPDFKSGRGREPVFGGFDSHSLPPGPSRQRSGGGQ